MQSGLLGHSFFPLLSANSPFVIGKIVRNRTTETPVSLRSCAIKFIPLPHFHFGNLCGLRKSPISVTNTAIPTPGLSRKASPYASCESGMFNR